ncbi:MAG: HEAT repeat domain-containing protein [Planctomycetota bacterium]
MVSAFPSLEFCIQVAGHFPSESDLLLNEEWIALLTTHYTVSKRDLFFRQIHQDSLPLKHWSYEALIRLDAQDPELFEALLQYQMNHPTLNLWPEIQKHPRVPFLKEWLALPEKQSLVLNVYQKIGQIHDLQTLFEWTSLSPENEALQHLAIQKIVENYDCTSVLIELINNASLQEQIRLSALALLVRKEQQKSVAFLYTLCDAKYPGTLRKQALLHLEKFEGSIALAQYSSSAEDSDSMIRLLGTMLLLKYEREQGIRLLRQQIQDPSWPVRHHAMLVLTHLEEQGIEEEMINTLQENQPEQNQIILNLLARHLQTPEAEQSQFVFLTKQLQKYRNIPEIPSYLAEFQQPELLPFLEKCCSAEYSSEVRESAIRSLSQIYSPRTVQILTSIVRTQKTKWGVIAIDSLAYLAQQDPQILKQYFINYLDFTQPTALRVATTHALKQTYQKEAIPLLLIALRDKRKEVVQSAQESLAYLTGQNWTREKEWQNWWNHNQDMNFEALFLRKKQPTQTLLRVSIQKLLSDHLEQRNVALKELAPQWCLLLPSSNPEKTLLNEFQWSTENPVDVVLNKKERLSPKFQRELLQLLTGSSWEEIQDYEWWWPILRASRR